MMYNRYVPDAAGVYRPTRVEDVPPPPPVPPPVPEAPPLPVRQDAGGLLSRLLPRSIDTGDLLMLLILLLLAVDGEEEDSLSVLLTAAAFLLS